MPERNMAKIASALDGKEWLILIQNGKRSRAQIDAVIAFARANYKTDNLPEGATNLYFTKARAIDALAEILDQIAVALSKKTDKSMSVVSVNGATGEVSITKASLGLDKVNNTSDVEKPVSTPQKTALDAKANMAASPVSRPIVFGQVYQATDKTKTAIVSITVETTYTVTLAGVQSDTVELRIGPDSAKVLDGSGGFGYTSFKSALTGIALTVGMANTQRNQLIAFLPPNWYFALRRIAGTTAVIQSALDQPL